MQWTEEKDKIKKILLDCFDNDKYLWTVAEKELLVLLSQRDEYFLEKLNSLNTKDHVCALNDGDQNCDCYTQAINDIKKKVL